MPVTVSVSQRESILRYATILDVDVSDPVALSAAAIPLLEWAEKAADGKDLRTRLNAMERHRYNVRLRCATSATPPGPQTPEKFLESAQVLYAFMTAGLPGGEDRQ